MREKRLVRQDRADRHTGEDPGMGKTERDVCLFHEDDNDQSACPCPSPLINRSSADLEDLMVLPCQVWYDTEAPEAFERDGFVHDRRDRAAFDNVSPIRGSNRVTKRDISANSKFLNMSVGTQKDEGEFAVRNVTKLKDDAGQLTDEGREALPSEADGPVRSVESAERIMRLLRSKRSFSELKDQY